MTVTPPTGTTDRRALGLARSRNKRRPGTAMVVVGVLMIGIGAFLAGWSRSDKAASPPAGAASSEQSAAGQEELTGNDPATPSSTSSPAPGASRVGPTLAIPAGHDGIAITLPFTAAGGGYVGPGDRVNVHLANGPAADAVVSVLRNVTVLDVSIEVAPRVVTGSAERPSASQVTYLLAVPVDRVGDLVAAAQTDGLYLSLVARDSGSETPDGATPSSTGKVPS